MPLKDDRGGKLYADLVGKRKQTKLTRQVVHGDLFGNVLFVGDADPGLIDFHAVLASAGVGGGGRRSRRGGVGWR